MDTERAIERHWHWAFLAFDGEPDAKEIHWSIAVEVMGYQCEADARIAALDIVPREQCRLRRVWECSTCGFQQQAADSMTRLAEKA